MSPNKLQPVLVFLICSIYKIHFCYVLQEHAVYVVEKKYRIRGNDGYKSYLQFVGQQQYPLTNLSLSNPCGQEVFPECWNLKTEKLCTSDIAGFTNLVGSLSTFSLPWRCRLLDNLFLHQVQSALPSPH